MYIADICSNSYLKGEMMNASYRTNFDHLGDWREFLPEGCIFASHRNGLIFQMKR